MLTQAVCVCRYTCGFDRPAFYFASALISNDSPCISLSHSKIISPIRFWAFCFYCIVTITWLPCKARDKLDCVPTIQWEKLIGWWLPNQPYNILGRLRFGGTHCLHQQVRRVSWTRNQERKGAKRTSACRLAYTSTLKMETVLLKYTRERLSDYRAFHPRN
jgi:hypothetical protein